MGVVFSNGEDFANVRIYSGSAPVGTSHYIFSVLTKLFIMGRSRRCE